MESLSIRGLGDAHSEYERGRPHFTRCLGDLRDLCGGDRDSRHADGLLDLDPPEPCPQLIHFLNCWGCHIPKNTPREYKTATDGFRRWHDEFGGRLPSMGRRLRSADDLRLWRDEVEAELAGGSSTSFAGAFDALRDALVADRAGYRRRFSHVAASKILYVLRPHLFLAWDNRIRGNRFRSDGDSYLRYVVEACTALLPLAEPPGDGRQSLQQLQERNGCTALEFVNKYYWISSRRR